MKFPPMKQMACTLAGLAATGLAFAQAEPVEPVRWQLNMTPGVTSTAANAFNAHMIMLWICVVIGVIVFGAMAGSGMPKAPSRIPISPTAPNWN